MLSFRSSALVIFVSIVLAGMETGARAQSAEPAPEDAPSIRMELLESRTRADGIAEDLRRMQARLRALESHLRPSPQADIALVNALSSAFVVTGIRIWVDDTTVFAREDEAGALGGGDLHALSGPISPGDHIARIALQVRGNGAILPYMSAYRFQLESSHALRATAGQTAAVTIRAFERGNELTPHVQLPALEWRERAAAPR